MAKITAFGAHEVARIATLREGHSCLWVINSKGVVLFRFTGSASTSYTIQRRNVSPVTREQLVKLAEQSGHEVVS